MRREREICDMRLKYVKTQTKYIDSSLQGWPVTEASVSQLTKREERSTGTDEEMYS